MIKYNTFRSLFNESRKFTVEFQGRDVATLVDYLDNAGRDTEPFVAGWGPVVATNLNALCTLFKWSDAITVQIGNAGGDPVLLIRFIEGYGFGTTSSNADMVEALNWQAGEFGFVKSGHSWSDFDGDLDTMHTYIRICYTS